MLARNVYDSLVIAIGRACERRGFLEVCDSAVQFGMKGGEIKGGMSLRYEYSYIGEDGQSVGLSIRSYDPSGPFQNEPDINRFTAKL